MLEPGSLRSLLMNAVLLSSLLAFSHALLKWVARHEVSGYMEMMLRFWPFVFASLALYGFIFFYYIQVLRRHDIGILYGVYTGLSVVLVLMIGMFFFRESLTRLQLLGCLFIVVGILLIGSPSLQSGSHKPDPGSESRL